MIKMARKKRKENPAGCAGEGKQRKVNIGEEKRTVDSANYVMKSREEGVMHDGLQTPRNF